MKTRDVLGCVCVLLASATGCIAPDLSTAADPGEEEIDSSAEALASGNALSLNALSLNALSLNALSLNALSLNALGAEALDALQDPGEEGELVRQLVKYTVSCALDESRSFRFAWTDAAGSTHEEVYRGQLGLADSWRRGPLDDAGKQMVSACLAARTNRYGVSVVISMRSHQDPLRHEVGRDERETYPHVEGAFWGDLFSETPYLRACYNDASVARARAAQRDCAAGQLDAAGELASCGMIEIVGSCQERCGRLHPPGQYYKDCRDPESGKTRFVVTTALR
ncbi:hypothetical protein SOCE26_084600 [Sorangium cellulosum]|uniref:Secreted protein n=1 Tax=Sorangium cellulosum TaxID=56 RepID=A0A2L0F5V7_SORCE|nr:hypothetical protein [Sorangium cellulosum]AUX46950.1 hypothetical protein SOCE26_084600 [Sorangium cellulosum]